MAFEQEGQQFIVVVLGSKNKADRAKTVERTLATVLN
jgi:D-alanyl-D-alanine carboxypeptidase